MDHTVDKGMKKIGIDPNGQDIAILPNHLGGINFKVH